LALAETAGVRWDAPDRCFPPPSERARKLTDASALDDKHKHPRLAARQTGGRMLGRPRKAHHTSDQRVVATVSPLIGLREQFLEAM